MSFPCVIIVVPSLPARCTASPSSTSLLSIARLPPVSSSSPLPPSSHGGGCDDPTRVREGTVRGRSVVVVDVEVVSRQRPVSLCDPVAGLVLCRYPATSRVEVLVGSRALLTLDLLLCVEGPGRPPL